MAYYCNSGTIFVIATILLVSLVPAYTQLSGRCAQPDSGRRICYQRYGSPSDSYTWQQAYDNCLAGGGELVTVESEQVQDGLFNLVGAITGGGDRHVWIAGRLSQDRNWTYVDGGEASEPSQGNVAVNGSCAVLYLDGSEVGLGAFVCERNFWKALCQYDEPSRGEDCIETDDFLYIGKCHRVLDDPQGWHWNKARQQCRSQITGGDLAHTHIDTVDFRRRVQAHIMNKTQTKMWVGLTSRRWVWKKESGDIPMEYTKFRGGVGFKSYVFLDAGDEGKWDAKDLATDTSPYYICQHAEIITTPTITTTTNTSTTSTTTTTAAPATTASTPSPAPTTVPAPSANPSTTPSNTPARSTTSTSSTTTPARSQTSNVGAETTPIDSAITTTSKTNAPDASTGQFGPLNQTHIIVIGVIGGALLIVVIIVIIVIVTRGSRQKDSDIAMGPTYNNHIDPNTSSVIMDSSDAYKQNEYTDGPLDAAGGGGGYDGIDDGRMRPIVEVDEQASAGDGYKMSPEGDLYRLPDKLSRPNSMKLDSDLHSIPED